MPIVKQMQSRRAALAVLGGTLAGTVLGRKLARAQGGGAEEAQAHSLHLTQPPAALPDFQFTDAMGERKTIQTFAGKGVVLNFWATWCAPCVEEMPSLDRLAEMLRPDGIVVLPLSADRGGAQTVDSFYRKHGINHLGTYLDSSGAAQAALGLRGIPTTVIIDRHGQERARLEGGTDWTAPGYREAIGKLTA